MSNVSIRSGTIDDALAIAAIHCASWRDAYANVLDATFLDGPIEYDRAALWTRRLSNPINGQSVLIAYDATGKSIGFVCAYRDMDVEWGSLIDNLHVLPGLRGKNIGRQLMLATAQSLANENAGSKTHLWVFEANVRGLGFYERLGGKVVERSFSQIPAANGAPILRVYWPSFLAQIRPA
jgi:ribosomal protein S18 acetylase RimI-like enzyme